MAPAPERYIDEPRVPRYRNPETARARAALHPYHGAFMNRFRALQFRARPLQPWHLLRPAERRIIDSSTGELVPDDELPPEGPVTLDSATQPARSGSGWSEEDLRWGESTDSGWGERSGSGWGDDWNVAWSWNPDGVAATAARAAIAERTAAAAERVAAAAAERVAATAPAPAPEHGSGWDAEGNPLPWVQAWADWTDNTSFGATSSVTTTTSVTPPPAEVVAVANAVAVARAGNAPPPPTTTRVPRWGQRYETKEEFRERLKEAYVVAQAQCAKTNTACRLRWACEACSEHPGAPWFMAGEQFVDEEIDDGDTDCGSVNGLTPPPSPRARAQTRERLTGMRRWYSAQEREVGEQYPMFGRF